MLREGLVVLAALSIGGCAASARLNPEFGEEDQQTSQSAQMAAFAAQSQYPQDAEAQETEVAAIVDRNSGTVKLYNFTEEPIRNASLWVNNRFVYQLDNLGRGESIVIQRSQFFNRDGKALSSLNDPITNVQLQTQDQLLNVLGPAFEAQVR